MRGTDAAACRRSGRLELTHLGWVVRVQLREAIARYGCVPVVLTSSSFVVATFEATDVGQAGGDHGMLRLRPVGPWAQAFRERRLYSPPGNQWLLWTPEIMGVP